jgi:hypothetical protein
MSTCNARLALVMIVLFLAGCDADDIQTSYGGRTGPLDGPSVNGTSVLADMLQDAGHNVISRTSLSPGLNDGADVIIWFPDDFRTPNANVVQWLESWLSARSGRTAVYIGRDYDAAVTYWRTVEPTAPPAQAAEAKNRRTMAEGDFDQARSSIVDGESCGWFAVKSLPQPRRVTALAGPWSAGVDPKKCEIALYSTYQFSAGDEVLLSDGTDTIVARRRFYSPQGWSAGDSNQLIVFTNGSFLLNVPLVNHEHRKLAAHLINELPPSSRVVFLESDAGGPPIRESDPVAQTPNGFEVFSIWPIGAVLLHLAALGLVFCFARLPIFGVPRDPPEASLSDFGKHVSALGELLHRTRDSGYAHGRIEQYRQTVRETAAAPGKRTKTNVPKIKL